MIRSQSQRAIPTKPGDAQFEQLVLPHLSRGRRGPRPGLSLCKIFNYVLQALYMGCQWKMLPAGTNAHGRPEIHPTRIYRMMRRWQAHGSIERVFAGTVHQLRQDQRLDLSVIHGDGTTTVAKKGGDNLGGSGRTRAGAKTRSVIAGNASTRPSSGSVSGRLSAVFSWEDKFRRLLLRFGRISVVHYALKTLAYTMIKLQHYC